MKLLRSHLTPSMGLVSAPVEESSVGPEHQTAAYFAGFFFVVPVLCSEYAPLLAALATCFCHDQGTICSCPTSWKPLVSANCESSAVARVAWGGWALNILQSRRCAGVFSIIMLQSMAQLL